MRDVITENMDERYFTANDGRPRSEEQAALVAKLKAQIAALADTIQAEVPAGRNRSIALTSLEDVQMRANRAIFATGPSR